MNIKPLTLSTALFAATLFASSALAANSSNSSKADSSSKQNASKTEQTNSEQAQKNQQNTPDGWLMVDDRVVYLFANEPQEHLMHARQLLDQKDNKAAASEVRIASGYLDMQASRKGDEKGSKALHEEADKLNQFASDIDKNQKTSPDQLNKQFATSYLALADFHRQMASQELKEQKGIRAGHDLNAACISLQQAVATSNAQPDKSYEKAMTDCNQLAMNLLNPSTGQSDQARASQSSQSDTASAKQSDSTDQAQAAAYQSGQDINENDQAIPNNAKKDCKELNQAIRKVRKEINSKSSEH